MLYSTEITALNRARDILAGVEKWGREAAWKVEKDELVDAHDLGRLSEAAARAEYAIFELLNIAHSHCRMPISDQQLHNRKLEEVEVDAH